MTDSTTKTQGVEQACNRLLTAYKNREGGRRGVLPPLPTHEEHCLLIAHANAGHPLDHKVWRCLAWNALLGATEYETWKTGLILDLIDEEVKEMKQRCRDYHNAFQSALEDKHIDDEAVALAEEEAYEFVHHQADRRAHQAPATGFLELRDCDMHPEKYEPLDPPQPIEPTPKKP